MIIKLIGICYLFGLTSCITTSVRKKAKPPMTSFVKIIKQVEVVKCRKDSNCTPGKYFSTGSGIIVGHTKKNTLILTAAHVCQVLIDDDVKRDVEILKSSVFVIDHKKRFIESVIIISTNPFLEKKDICLMATKRKIDADAVKVGKKPSVGDQSYNIAAPGGVTHLPAVPILHGIYSGHAEDVNSDLYSIPAIGGSSGSGIFNEDYELIGIVFASVRNFHHVTLSVRHEDLVEFLEEGRRVINQLNSK